MAARERSGPMSPLGRLYRMEYARLRSRFPDQDPLERDRYILLTLAFAFMDVDGEELARAMVEGSHEVRLLHNQGISDTVREMADRATATARKL